MKLGFLLFLLLPLFGIVYVVMHVWKMLPFAIWAKMVVAFLMVAAFALLFVGLRFSGKMSMPLSIAVYEIGTSWLIMLLYLFMLFLLLDFGRLMHLIPVSFMKNSWTGTLTVLSIMFVVFVYGNIHYHHKVRQPLTLTTSKHLSRPMKIIMASDLHLGYHNRREEFARWVDMMNQEKADLILIAGDIIDNALRPLEEPKMEEEFLRLNAPVVACLGNHEYYAGAPNSLDFYRKADITLLRDSVITLGDLCIVGRDDRSHVGRKSVSQLMRQADKGKYVILLDHQPYHLEHAEKAGVDFQLSGHTHYGQVWPISWITKVVYECAFGEWQRGNTRYYVSSGLGIWGGKFRIGTRSEYVVAELRSKR